MRALLRACARARPLALALTFPSAPHPFPVPAPRRSEKGTSPNPPRGPAEPPEPTPRSGAGTPSEEEISRGFSLSSPVSPKELKMAENVVEPGPPSAKRPKLSSPALSASASDGTGWSAGPRLPPPLSPCRSGTFILLRVCVFSPSVLSPD